MKHWSNYWNSSQTLNSFAETDTGQGYTGEIKEFWNTVFSKQAPNSKIVDIGSGNGALACLAVEYSNAHNLNFEVHAIDAADIDPVKSIKDKSLTAQLEQVTFHTSTSIEDITFDEQSIDLFISQFGFEYANVEKALKSTNKALKAGGEIVTLSHHIESHVSKDTKVGIDVMADVLDISPLFIQVDLLLDIAIKVKDAGEYDKWAENPYNRAISTTIRWILDKLKAQYQDSEPNVWLQDIFNRVVSVLRLVGKEDPNNLRGYLGQQYKLLDEHRLRLQDQVNATFSADDVALIVKQSEELNLSIKTSPFSVEEQLFAWAITISK